METRANQVWVGSVTLALIAVVAALVVWLTRLDHPQQDAYDIYFKQSVDGLAKGSGVSYAGVPAGQVKDIELWRRDPGFVKVRIVVNHKVPILIGTTATLQGSFTGVSTILLDGGVKGAPPITQVGPDGEPVIPTKQGGLGALLSNAPLLLERLATLTDRLSMLLSDKNQQSITNILANTDRMTHSLADTAPDVKRTMAEAQATLRQANMTLQSLQHVGDSANQMLTKNGDSLANQLRATMKSAQGAADELQQTLDQAKPAARQLNEQTLPSISAAMRDLQATTKSLRELTERINDKGLGGLAGGPKLPDYKP